ncbi:hypothetical protein QAD02_000806 [Eretmocerus hayati]|uniref:Uncharacterized protein n=1 Tax=Eretmocerus hayati TaxID=131215 RepID=A0ACC2NEL4_9HYME|nr:hypothetical protein QAD02_000806 [Eretmocerus hayati]
MKLRRVTVEDPQPNPCESAALEIEEAAAEAIKQANTWAGAIPRPPKSAVSATIVSADVESNDSSTKRLESLIGKEGTQLRSAPRRSKKIEWNNELQAAEELAKRGYASQLLEILKKNSEPNHAANTTTTIVSGYQPEPVGTPRLPPMIGVPIRTFLHQAAIPISTRDQGMDIQVYEDHHFGNQADSMPVDLSLNQGGASFTTTAKMGTETITTNSYNRPVISGVKRAFKSATNPIFVNKFAEFDQLRNSTEEQHIWINQNPRSLFTATTRNKKCVGPAIGVPVGKIPTNPWVAPQNEEQRKLLSALLTNKLKVGLLKAKDGRVIMRRKGLIVLQPDRLGWRCGACILRYPEKYNAWAGWIGHEIHQVGILDEFQNNGFTMICPDCGRNPASPTVLDDCTDSILTCICHWEDVSNGIIMESIPLRVDCLCSWMTAKELKTLKSTSTANPRDNFYRKQHE